MCLESVNLLLIRECKLINCPETCVESVSMKKINSRENLKPYMCLESVNQITVWRVNPETCVESVSMKNELP